jgi:phage/plasmid-associated DNA primase
MIEGCIASQEEGLKAPTAVRDATASYLAAEDTLAQWIREQRAELGQYPNPLGLSRV